MTLNTQLKNIILTNYITLKMKNNNNITRKCTISMSPYEKYNTTLSSLYFFFLKHNFYSFSLSFLIGILFFGVPCFSSYMLYLSGKLEYMFYPILISLSVLIVLFCFYFLFKIYLAITSKEFIPPWERSNIGSTFHGIIILSFIFLFCKKCNKCLNENISIESNEQSNKAIVSSFQKFIFVLIINGNYHENESNDKNVFNEVFNIDDDKNKVIVKVLLNIFHFVISPLVYLSLYLLIKVILIKTKYSFEKLLMLLCIFLELFYVNQSDNKMYQINFILFISSLIEIKIRTIYKITKNHPPRPYTTNTSEEIYFFFDYILLFFFQILLICSYIFFIVSYYYIIYLGQEKHIIKGKLIFNLGVFLFFLGNCFIFGNSITQMVFSPIRKNTIPSKMKAHYIQVKYLKPIIQGGIQAETDEETANLLSYN